MRIGINRTSASQVEAGGCGTIDQAIYEWLEEMLGLGLHPRRKLLDYWRGVEGARQVIPLIFKRKRAGDDNPLGGWEKKLGDDARSGMKEMILCTAWTSVHRIIKEH